MNADIKAQNAEFFHQRSQAGVQGVEPLENQAGVLVKGQVPAEGGASAGGKIKDGNLGVALGDKVLHTLPQGVQIQPLDGLKVLLSILPQGGVHPVLVKIVQGDADRPVAVAGQPLRQDAGGGGLAGGGGAAEENHLGFIRLRPPKHLDNPLAEGLFLRKDEGLGVPPQQLFLGGEIQLFHNRCVFHPITP